MQNERVTDEMVERAKKAWNSISDEHNGWHALSQDERDTYTALTAALSSAEVKAVEVKKLEWQETRGRNGYGVFLKRAETCFLNYRIMKGSQGKFEVYCSDYPFSGAMRTIEEAEAWAQQDYETRIRSALVDVPAVESEPVAYLRLESRTDIDGETYTALQMSDVTDERSFPVYAHPPRSSLIQSESLAIEDVLAKIKDYGEDALPGSEYRLACDDLIEAFSALSRKTAAPGDGSDIGTEGGDHVRED